jgi:hypothetical protein
MPVTWTEPAGLGVQNRAGIIAAASILALRHHVKRLAENHGNARRLAEGLADLPGAVLDHGGQGPAHRPRCLPVLPSRDQRQHEPPRVRGFYGPRNGSGGPLPRKWPPR